MSPQALRMYEYLKKNKTVMPMEAWDRLGIYRLSARIHDLRTADIDISMELVEVTNSYGETCRVARYTLNDPSKETI